MGINGITSNNTLLWGRERQPQKTETAKPFSEQIENAAGRQQRTHVVYIKTDDMLYSGGNGAGLSFYIKYAEGSTEEDPTVVAKGVDEHGNEFEQTIHIKKINPGSATLVEMHALEAYLGVEKEGRLSSLPYGTGQMGLHDRGNFMDMFQKNIRDMDVLGERKSAAYYRYSMQAYWDFMMEKAKGNTETPKEKKASESKSDTEIITNPDGSRTLLVTAHIGEMEMVTSVELSKPNPMVEDDVQKDASGQPNNPLPPQTE